MDRLSLRATWLIAAVCLLAMSPGAHATGSGCDDPICLLQAREPGLNQFRILARRALDQDHEVMLVQGSEVRFGAWYEQDYVVRRPLRQLSGVFLLDRRQHRVTLTLDLLAANFDIEQGPVCDDTAAIEIEEASPDAVSILRVCTDHANYGAIKQARRKYLLAPAYQDVRKTLSFANPGFVSIRADAGKLSFLGPDASLELVPADPSRFSLGPASPDEAQPEKELRLLPNRARPVYQLYSPYGSEWLLKGDSPLSSGIVHLASGSFYPLPQPTLAEFKRLRSGRGNFDWTPHPLEVDIGGYQLQGNLLWLATRFYDGEGASGIGALGWFDLTTRRYELPFDNYELADWSVNALSQYGGSIWLGLYSASEGWYHSGGLYRYELKSGEGTRYRFRPIVNAMYESPQGLWLATNEGVYLLANERLSYFGLSQDEQGKPLLYRREVPLRPYE